MLRKIRMRIVGGDAGSCGGQAGFSMMELMVVLALSLIIMAGMAGLVEMANNAFSSSRTIESVTDSGRRTLSSISRQVKTALHIDDNNCTTSPPQLSFWGDVDSDNPTADVDHYSGTTGAEYVQFFQAGTNLMERITEPDGTVKPDMSLGRNISSVQFLYFSAGEKPVYDEGSGTYTNAMASGYNSGAGMVKVILQYSRKGIQRKFEQDMFLRILVRSQ